MQSNKYFFIVTCKFTSCCNDYYNGYYYGYNHGYYNGYYHGYYSTGSVTVMSWLITQVHLSIHVRHSLQSTQHNIDILWKDDLFKKKSAKLN